MHMHIASHHNLSLRLIHKFFFLLPMNIDKTSIQTFLSPEIFAMLSDHTYSAKCSRCEVCPDCGLDPKIHYKKEEVPKLLTSKIFRHQFIYDVFVSVFKRHTLWFFRHLFPFSQAWACTSYAAPIPHCVVQPERESSMQCCWKFWTQSERISTGWRQVFPTSLERCKKVRHWRNSGKGVNKKQFWLFLQNSTFPCKWSSHADFFTACPHFYKLVCSTAWASEIK